MKKLICIVFALVMALSLAAFGGNEIADTQTDKLYGTVSTDGSTSMEKVIGGLGEMFILFKDNFLYWREKMNVILTLDNGEETELQKIGLVT